MAVVAAKTLAEHDTTTPHNALERSSRTSFINARFCRKYAPFASSMMDTSFRPNRLFASSDPRPCVSGAMRLVAKRKISINAGNPYGSLVFSECSCAVMSTPGPAVCGLSTTSSPSSVVVVVVATGVGVVGMTTASLGATKRLDLPSASSSSSAAVTISPNR